MYLENYNKSDNPRNAEYYYLFWGLYKRLGWEKQADEVLVIALKMDPDVRKRVKLFLNHKIVPFKRKLPQEKVQ